MKMIAETLFYLLGVAVFWIIAIIVGYCLIKGEIIEILKNYKFLWAIIIGLVLALAYCNAVIDNQKSRIEQQDQNTQEITELYNQKNK